MIEIKLQIKSCKDCPYKEERNIRSIDGYERLADWYCKKSNKKISHAVELSEEEFIKVPDWCEFL